MEERYQGREIQATLKAPTSEQLERMLVALNEYSTEHEMEEIQVLKKGKDPDGGWEAVVVAHNFNPLSWAREKWETRGGGFEARTSKQREAREKRLERLRAETTAAKERAEQFTEESELRRQRTEAAKTIAAKQDITRQSLREQRKASGQVRRTQIGMAFDPILDPLKALESKRPLTPQSPKVTPKRVSDDDLLKEILDMKLL